MNEHFELLLDHIRLTPNQQEEVKRKYDGVSHSLHSEFYPDRVYNSHTRLIIGSHGKKTATRYPIGDIDLIFKISKDDLEHYQSLENGPSELLRRAKEKLQQTYASTEEIKTWGKVVLVKFGDDQHNVEVLPCYENDDKTFTVPNTENNGSWDNVDYRAEMKNVEESNAATGITRNLIKIIKRWKNECNVGIKSYQIEFFAINYLNDSFEENKTYSEMVEEFFNWLDAQSADFEGEKSKVTTAKNRAYKAREYEIEEKYNEACNEWKKIFGDPFPSYNKNLCAVKALEAQYPIEEEEFISDKFDIHIDPSATIQISSTVKRTGFRDMLLPDFLQQALRKLLPKNASLVFNVTCSLGKQANYYWKIRNFGDEANKANNLRGEIIKDAGGRSRTEYTKYLGTHYVECYAVKNNSVVATKQLFVPIGSDYAE